MSLSSSQLDAFIAVAREKNFSRAANKLHITQSALSQRIANLEEALGSTLFIRQPAGVVLTELGTSLVRYCQMKEGLESEFLTNIKSSHRENLAGILKIGAFSTITKSLLMPMVGAFIKKNPAVQVCLYSREVSELPNLLMSGQADYIFLTYPLNKQGIENHLLGYEENVLIQSKNRKCCEDVYLDHDEADTTTLEFFKIQKTAPKVVRRSYLDEIYLIVEGVLQGLGRAVVPLHIAKGIKGVEVVSGYKPLRVPIYFTYHSQPFYTQLQQQIITEFKQANLSFR